MLLEENSTPIIVPQDIIQSTTQTNSRPQSVNANSLEKGEHKRDGDNNMASPQGSYKKQRTASAAEFVPKEEVQNKIEDTLTSEVILPVVGVTTDEYNGETEEYPIMKASYQYKAKAEHELSFDVGDSIVWFKEEHEGWYRGTNQKSQFSGWFPSNYVKNTGDIVVLPKIEDIDQNISYEEDQQDQINNINIDTSKRSSRIRELQKKLAERNDINDNIFKEDE